MNKKQFLKELNKSTNYEITSYYDELISDRIEQGEDETSVVASYDIKKILKESEFKVAKKELETKSKRGGRGLTVLLVLFSAPITIPLAFAFIIVMLSFLLTSVILIGAPIAGTVYAALSTIESIRINESAEFIILGLGLFLLALAAIGIVGTVLSKYLFRFYKWTLVKFFSMAKRRAA
ncbi:MAG: DUF1700 domain-containing protein [Firmicutes bacterium]|nr:DUF1700 domain-containing protein [Bacillota bacterium]